MKFDFVVAKRTSKTLQGIALYGDVYSVEKYFHNEREGERESSHSSEIEMMNGIYERFLASSTSLILPSCFSWE